MPSFLLRRLIHGVFVVWGVVTAVFFLVRLTGDPSAFLVDQSATREEIAHTRHLLGQSSCGGWRGLHPERAVPAVHPQVLLDLLGHRHAVRRHRPQPPPCARDAHACERG